MGQTNDEDCVTSRSLNFTLIVVVFDEIGPSRMASYAMLLIESLDLTASPFIFAMCPLWFCGSRKSGFADDLDSEVLSKGKFSLSKMTASQVTVEVVCDEFPDKIRTVTKMATELP
jgi:hypothetical protein